MTQHEIRSRDEWSLSGAWNAVKGAAKGAVGKLAGAAAGWLIGKLPAGVRKDMAKLVGTIDGCFFDGGEGCTFGKDVPFFVQAGATCGGGGDVLTAIKGHWHEFVPLVKKALQTNGVFLREMEHLHQRGVLNKG